MTARNIAGALILLAVAAGLFIMLATTSSMGEAALTFLAAIGLAAVCWVGIVLVAGES